MNASTGVGGTATRHQPKNELIFEIGKKRTKGTFLGIKVKSDGVPHQHKNQTPPNRSGSEEED